MLYDITTLEELSYSIFIALYLQSNSEDREGLEMRFMGTVKLGGSHALGFLLMTVCYHLYAIQ